jgi:antitoxin VapB
MGLNIKNERTHALVRELATISGMSQTEAVEDAVRRRIAQLSGQTADEVSARRERFLAIAKEMSEHLSPESFEDVNDWLYEENGLPR